MIKNFLCCLASRTGSGNVRPVLSLELLLQFVEVTECEALRVSFVAKHQVANALIQLIVKHVRTRFHRAPRLVRLRQFPEQLFRQIFVLCQILILLHVLSLSLNKYIQCIKACAYIVVVHRGRQGQTVARASQDCRLHHSACGGGFLLTGRKIARAAVILAHRFNLPTGRHELVHFQTAETSRTLARTHALAQKYGHV